MAYTKVEWLNSGETGAKPINKTNLNQMDNGIFQNANDIAANSEDIDENTNAIGTLSDLNTTQKSNLVSAINEVNSALANKQATIQSGTSLPATVTNGQIFLLYSE